MKRINKTAFIFSILIILETILIKMLMFQILPAKYFYDSSKILAIMSGATIADKAYMFTAKFFEYINIFHFSSLQEWSTFLTLICSCIIIYFISKRNKYSLSEYLFIIASIALLNIYVFNISKDMIQFIIFLLLFLIIKNKKINNLKKLILCCILLIFEALSFRIYYGIMAMIMITMYFVYSIFIKNKELTKKNIFKIIIITLALLFLEIFIVQLISYDNYISILFARADVNQYRIESVDAVTIIIDLLGNNTNYLIFIGNYLINACRLMIPIELLFKGIKYIPFIIYQIFITYSIFKSAKNINDKNVMLYITVISFLLISIIFEPDFGSFIRHESTLTLLLLEIIHLNYKNNKEGESNGKEYII